MDRYHALRANGTSITSVLAESEEQARSLLTKNLSKSGLEHWLSVWQAGGERVKGLQSCDHCPAPVEWHDVLEVAEDEHPGTFTCQKHHELNVKSGNLFYSFPVRRG